METLKKERRRISTVQIAVIGGAFVVIILVLTTLLMGRSAQRSTEQAVYSVSNFYLQELAWRREQVVASNLNNSIENMRDALDLLDENDLSDMEHLQAFQARMKKLYTVEKFAFVDTDGLIYTSLGTQTNISEYSFGYNTISARRSR